MPASVCQHESGRFIGPVKDKPRRYWHYRIAQFPAFQRQTAAFSADLTLELSKSHQGFGDAYEESLVRTVSSNDADAGATTLVLDDGSSVASGMRVQGANIPVYATVTWVSANGAF